MFGSIVLVSIFFWEIKIWSLIWLITSSLYYYALICYYLLVVTIESYKTSCFCPLLKLPVLCTPLDVLFPLLITVFELFILKL